jgi:hypothetical protein
MDASSLIVLVITQEVTAIQGCFFGVMGQTWNVL